MDDSSRLFREQRQGRRGWGVALFVTEGIECMELIVGNGTVESLWVRIKGQTSKVRVYYRPPGQDDATLDVWTNWEMRCWKAKTEKETWGSWSITS